MPLSIIGGIFASPSIASILAAIRTVTPDPNATVKQKGSCLLIVKNYTGDRLNFGMACEMANNEGRKVKMVVVADDAALEREKGVTGARGVAGTVFVHKVAGATAEKGASLDEVVAAAQSMCRKVRSLGVALNAVTIPGATCVNDRLDSSKIEIGMGIHGEAGIKQSHLQSADELASIMVQTIEKYGIEEGEGSEKKVVPTFNSGDDLAVMINNLGGTSNFEMSILANSVVNFLERKNCTISRLYVGSFMTSFDMQGASVSILSLDDKLSDLLDAACSASAWEKADITHGVRPSLTELPEVVTAEAISMDNTKYALKHVDIEDFGKNTEAALRAVCRSLIESEPILTKYDIIVGDGDCGMTMERGAKEILSRLESKELNISHPVPLFESLAVAVSASMGGTSGVLVEIMFRKMSSFLKEQSVLNRATMQLAFERGVESISFYGGASVGSRTMLDALSPAVEALKNGQDAAKAAVNGAQSTAAMGSASAGRSNYLNEDALIGTPDPGAVAVGLVLSAVYATIA